VLFVEDRFDWTATEVGLSLGTFGALVALAQAFAIGPVTRWHGERGTLLLGIVCEAVAMLILAFAQASWIVFLVIPLLAFGGIGLPALRSLQTNAVEPERQGQLQGVIASFGGLAAIFGPLAFSWIYTVSRSGWTGVVWLVGVAIYAVTVPVVLAVADSARRPA
jgi:DHA1 family tetracycline resistance protein-like MFS transporter